MSGTKDTGEIELNFYIIRNKEGKYFRRKGYGGYGDNWVTDVLKARVYSKIGPARGVVGFYANNYPSYGVPDLLHFKVSDFTVIDETARVTKAKERKEKSKTAQKIREKEWEIQHAQQQLEEAQATLNRLKRRR